MKTKAFWGVVLLMLLAGCGPIIGGMMVAGNGIKEFQVVSGDLADLKGNLQLAVLGPFAKTDRAFYICRGEEAASFASLLDSTTEFSAEAAIPDRFPKQLPTTIMFHGQSPAQVQAALGLKSPPTLLLSGTILLREMVTAPAQGVIMHVAYRLEFFNLESNRTTIDEVEVKELFQDAIPAVVNELRHRIATG